MSLSLQQVFQKVGKAEVGYVFDAPIHYVVLNKGQNTMTTEKIEVLLDIYDKIEATEGPGVVVTIGTGTNFFSTGFDLQYWAASNANAIQSIAKIQILYAKVLALGLPSMAVFNGHAMAGGLILGLAHDFRIMTDNQKSCVSLSEMLFGVALPPAFGALCADTLTDQAFSELVLGLPWNSKRAFEEKVVDGLFGSLEDCENQIKTFAKTYAKAGTFKNSIRSNKIHGFEATRDICLNNSEKTSMISDQIDGTNMAKVKTYLKNLAAAAKKKQKKPQPKL